MSTAIFHEVSRPWGNVWLHGSRPVWIVHYPEVEGVRFGFWQAYRAVAYIPPGRDPWTVDNRRIGPERGFKTLEDAARAAANAIEVAA